MQGMVGDGDVDGLFLSPPPLPRLSIPRPVMEKVLVGTDDGAGGLAVVFKIDVVKVVSLRTGVEDRLNVPKRVIFKVLGMA